MEMSSVSQCHVAECAYNCDDHCHAMAITIGDSIHPRCDTACIGSSDMVDTSLNAGVGACKTSCCVFNRGLECSSSEISVGLHGSEIDCLTFKAR